MRVAVDISLDEDERAVLEKIVRSNLSSVRLVQRARIVLLASEGKQNKDIAQTLDVGRVQVSRWRKRYADFGLPGIEKDLPRGAPPRTVDPDLDAFLDAAIMACLEKEQAQRFGSRDLQSRAAP